MIRNFRDLSGIKNSHGQVIPSGMLFRSANLSAAEPSDLAGISAVIDLRTDIGRERAPDRIPGNVSYHILPIFDEQAAGITRSASLDTVPDMVSLYREMITEHQDTIQAVLSVIFSHDFSTGGVLWHCTAGKDRCGVITAYVLAALGVGNEAIMADYMRSNDACIPEADAIREKLLAAGKAKEEADKVWDVFIAKEKYLNAALAEMTFEENPEFQKKIFGIIP